MYFLQCCSEASQTSPDPTLGATAIDHTNDKNMTPTERIYM